MMFDKIYSDTCPQFAVYPKEQVDVFIGEMIAVLESTKRPHYTCEDNWYSCPASGERCRDDGDTSCECGAERFNARIDQHIIGLKEVVK